MGLEHALLTSYMEQMALAPSALALRLPVRSLSRRPCTAAATLSFVQALQNPEDRLHHFFHKLGIVVGLSRMVPRHAANAGAQLL